jgi:hypothetical protein
VGQREQRSVLIAYLTQETRDLNREGAKKKVLCVLRVISTRGAGFAVKNEGERINVF